MCTSLSPVRVMRFRFLPFLASQLHILLEPVRSSVKPVQGDVNGEILFTLHVAGMLQRQRTSRTRHLLALQRWMAAMDEENIKKSMISSGWCG